MGDVPVQLNEQNQQKTELKQNPLLEKDQQLKVGPVQDQHQQNKQQDQAPVQQQRTSEISSVLEKIAEAAENGALKSLERKINANIEEGKDSISHVEMTEAFKELMQLCEKIRSGGDYSNTDVALTCLRLSEAADAYIAHHDYSVWMFTDKGETLRRVALNLKKLTGGMFEALEKKVKGANEENEGQAVNVTKKEAKEAKGRIEELAKHYKDWNRTIGSDYSLDEPDEKLRKRYKIMCAYKDDIETYRAYMRDGGSASDDVKAMIAEYDKVSAECRFMKWAREKDHIEAPVQGEVMGTLREHTREVSDNTHDETKLDEKEVDKGLTKEQLKGINDIDRWFLRNYSNGGVMGAIASSMKNKNDELVMKLLSMTKRERLHIYYLIETNKRKSPSPMDVSNSQINYIPNLDQFKGRMLATKWKFVTRATGGYVYMHKLEEAMEICGYYKNEVKFSGQIMNPAGGGQPEGDAGDQRMPLMRDLYQKIGQVKTLTESLKNVDKKDQAKTQKDIADATEEARNIMQRLIDEDNRFADPKTEVKNKENKNEDEVTSHVSYGLSALAQTDTVAEFLGAKELSKTRIITGDISGVISGLGQAMATVLAVYNHIHFSGAMNTAEYLTSWGDMASTALTSVNEGYRGIQIAHHGFKAATKAPAVVKLGAASAGISLGIDLYKSATSQKRQWQAEDAATYFKDKKAALEEMEKNKQELTNDQKLQLKKDRYAENMAKLSQDLAKKNKTTSAIKAIGDVATMVGVFIPGIGTIMSLVGIGITAIATLVDIIKTGSAQTAMFDAYYHTEDLYNKIIDKKPQWANKKKDALMDSIRRSVAAADGFANVEGACNRIAKIYAKQAHDVLFGGNSTQEEIDNYTNLVNSYGLEVNIEKGRPTEYMLARKMSGR